MTFEHKISLNSQATWTKARRQQRGAAVFIVVMAITLLTAVGIFAARSASLVDVATGHSRQALQTQYVTEYGIMATATELGLGRAGVYKYEGQQGNFTCRANEGLDTLLAGNPFCVKMFLPELNDRLNQSTGLTAEFLSSNALAGASSLGPYGASSPGALQGNLVVELTDAGPAPYPIAGNDEGGVNESVETMQFTLTVIGQILPTGDLKTCDKNTVAVASKQTMRATVIASPVSN